MIIAVLALLASLAFNFVQYRWRETDKAQQQRKEREGRAKEQRKEQVPPDFYSFDGNPGPILVNGRRTAMNGESVDVWGLVTVVNRTMVPMKIAPLRLVVANTDWPCQNISFHVKSDTQKRSDRISLMGNCKEDYELHFRCPGNNRPAGDGELWLTSDNRAKEFAIPLRFS
jgi:hypothetical protein